MNYTQRDFNCINKYALSQSKNINVYFKNINVTP